MNSLCFATNMTSSEIAAWVQAVGSILAILGAAGVAVWQARAQHRNALTLHRIQRAETARSVGALAESSARAMAHVTAQLKDRQAVYDIAEGRLHCDIAEFGRLDSTLSGIPIYSLPHQLVKLTMVLGSTIRQCKGIVEGALQFHRQMDAETFEKLFTVLAQMNKSIALTSQDISTEIRRIENELSSRGDR